MIFRFFTVFFAVLLSLAAPLVVYGYLRGVPVFNRGFEYEGRSLGALLTVIGYLGGTLVTNYGAFMYVREYLRNKKVSDHDDKRVL